MSGTGCWPCAGFLRIRPLPGNRRPPRPPPQMALAPENDHGADGHVEVHISVQAQVADGPAVDVAHAGFQFVDDLHGPNLGAAGDGAPGKGGPQDIHRAGPGPELYRDHRHQVVDVLVGLQPFVLPGPAPSAAGKPYPGRFSAGPRSWRVRRRPWGSRSIPAAGWHPRQGWPPGAGSP